MVGAEATPLSSLALCSQLIGLSKNGKVLEDLPLLSGMMKTWQLCTVGSEGQAQGLVIVTDISCQLQANMCHQRKPLTPQLL